MNTHGVDPARVRGGELLTLGPTVRRNVSARFSLIPRMLPGNRR